MSLKCLWRATINLWSIRQIFKKVGKFQRILVNSVHKMNIQYTMNLPPKEQYIYVSKTKHNTLKISLIKFEPLLKSK